MQRKGVSQYRLIKTYGISNGQLRSCSMRMRSRCGLRDWKRSGRRRKNWKGKRTDRAERILMGGNLRLEEPTAWIKAMDFVRTEFSGCEKTRKTGC